jgi:hypothetical protein
MTKNSLVITIIVAIIVGALGFYGGTWYQKSQQGNLAKGMGQEFPSDTGSSRGMRGPGNAAGGGMINGEIVAIDDQSLTVKTEDGSNTIVFISDSTTINKTAEGTLSDLTSGAKVMVLIRLV